MVCTGEVGLYGMLKVYVGPYWQTLAFDVFFISSFLVALTTDRALQQAMAANTSGGPQGAERAYRAALKAPRVILKTHVRGKKRQ